MPGTPPPLPPLSFGPKLNKLWLHDEVPHMTRKLSPGIGYGAEPDQAIAAARFGELQSFGRVRSNAIAAAFEDYGDVWLARQKALRSPVGSEVYAKSMSAVPDFCRGQWNDFAVVERFVWCEFRRAGLDSANPDRNL